MGSDLQPEIRNEATHEIKDQYLDAAKAKQVLGWRPGFDLESSIGRTVDWYKEYFARG
jgi:CDP-glucose 4,6-dehydratase